VNINDAFTGVSSVDASALNTGDSLTFNTKTYGAGTELNSKSLGTMKDPTHTGIQIVNHFYTLTTIEIIYDL